MRLVAIAAKGFAALVVLALVAAYWILGSIRLPSADDARQAKAVFDAIGDGGLPGRFEVEPAASCNWIRIYYVDRRDEQDRILDWLGRETARNGWKECHAQFFKDKDWNVEDLPDGRTRAWRGKRQLLREATVPGGG
ncbi:MAG: hypothetical protein R3F30_08980 [Planctomycetota bacterium]